MKFAVPVVWFCLMLNGAIYLQAQSMQSLFLMLPPNCTPGLHKAGRETLLKKGEYTVPGKDETHERDYALDTVTSNFLSYESSEYGANENYEIKKLKIETGKYVLVFIKDGNVKNIEDKYIFKIYDIDEKSITENNLYFVPDNLDYSVFLKPGVPDSIKTVIAKRSFCAFDLDMTSTDNIMYHITLESDKNKIWLTGDTMIFSWDGKMFANTFIFEKEE